MRNITAAFILASITALYAGIYDYSYSPLAQSENNNTIFDGNFSEIIRYKPIIYNSSAKVNNEETFEKQVDDIKDSIKAHAKSGEKYVVTAVAHTRTDADKELQAVQKSTFFGELQDSLLENHAQKNDELKLCKKVLQKTKDALVRQEIKEQDIVLECREGKSPLYLEDDCDAQEKNYYINITLYKLKN